MICKAEKTIFISLKSIPPALKLLDQYKDHPECGNTGFGKRLLETRKKRGISQEELAARLGTKGPAIGRYERDEMKPSIEAAAKMADILNVSLFLDSFIDRMKLQGVL